MIGLSNRINTKFMFFAVYDYYYIGLSERFMDLIQKIELKDLNRKEIQDEYRYVRHRFGELTNLMANTFTAITQIVSIMSMVLLALTYSPVIFAVTSAYLIFVLLINQKLTGKRTYSYVQDREFVRRTEYFENICKCSRELQKNCAFLKRQTVCFESGKVHMSPFIPEIKRLLYGEISFRFSLRGILYFDYCSSCVCCL